MKPLQTLQLVCILVLFLSACTKSADAIPPGINVVISPAQVTLEPGAANDFTATVTGSSNTAVTWSTTGGEIVGTGNTITYTSPSSEGTYSLTATSQAESSKRADATITVVAGGGTPGPSMHLHVIPAALTFTEQGQSMTLEVTATDEQGQEVAVPADLIWHNSDASQVTVTSDPANPVRVTITAVAVPGSAVLSAQSLSVPDIVSPLVVVSSVVTKPNAVAISDSRLAFPTADPHDIDMGAFTDEEIADLLELVDEDTLRYPVILRGPPPLVGEVLFGSESAPILGKVLKVTTRHGLTLVQLEHVGLDEAFSDYAVYFNTEELLDAGATTVRSLQQHNVSGSDLQTLAVRDCELFGSLSGVTINALSPSPSFVPVFEWVLRPEHQRLLIGGRAAATATIGFDAQLSGAGTGTCKIGRPIRFERPIAAGWLAAVMNATIEVDRVVELKVSATGGPRVALNSGYSADLLIQVGLDCTVRCTNLSDFIANGEGRSDAVFDINQADGVDSSANVQASFYLETDAGVQIGGYSLLLTCKALDIIPGLLRSYNQKCIQLVELLLIDVFKARAGAEGQFVWDSPTRVLNNRASASIISPRGMAEASLEDDGLTRLFKYLKLTPVSISLANLEFTPFTLYKSHSSDTISVQSKATTGEVDDQETLQLEEGEVVTFTVKGKFEPGLAPLIDSPLTRGEVWLSPSKQLDGASVNANGDTLTVSFTVTKEFCEEANSTLHFLGFNKMLGGIDAAGYLGTVRVSCDEVKYEGPFELRGVLNHSGCTTTPFYLHGTVRFERSAGGDLEIVIAQTERVFEPPCSWRDPYHEFIGDTDMIGGVVTMHYSDGSTDFRVMLDFDASVNPWPEAIPGRIDYHYDLLRNRTQYGDAFTTFVLHRVGK